MLELYLSMVDTPEEKDLFEKMYYEYKQDMYAVAYSILNNVEDAEDAVSQAFFAIAKKFSKISHDSGQKLHAFAVITIRNTALNFYNKNKIEREHFVPVDYDVSKFWETMPDDDYIRLVETIKELPQDYKDVIMLYYVYGFSAKNVGKQLNISEDAVRKRAERAKLMLKDKLKKEDHND